MSTTADQLRSQRIPIQQVVDELVDALGAPMVAVIAGEASTRAVRAWRNGEYQPKNGQVELRFALRIVDIIATRNEKDVIKAWFGGLNDLLNDQNPALLIASGDHAAMRDVLNAARAFISM
jgi:hypothetical protein